MLVRRIACAFLALLGLPAVTFAGPIEFRYTATGSPRLSPGQWMPGDLWFALASGGQVRLPATGGPIELGSVELRPSPGPQAPDSYTAYAPFEVSVTITDTANRTDTLTLAGGAIDEWTHRSWDGRWLNTLHRLDLGDSYHGNASQTSTVLGDTRYTLAVRPENDNQVGAYTLRATALTPEPGTLALAALGLAPLALRRLRRMW